MTKVTLPPYSKERLWVTGCSENGRPLYLITSSPDRTVYYIYQVKKGGEVIRVGKGKNPQKLEMMFLNGSL